MTWHQPILFLFSYLRPQLGRVLALAAVLVASLGLQLIGPQVLRNFIDTASAGLVLPALTGAAVLFISVELARHALALAARYWAENVGWYATNAVRADLTLHCLRLDMSFHKAHTPGELIERIDGDVATLADLFSQFVFQVLANLLLLAGIVLLLWRESAPVSAGLAVYAACILGGLAWMQHLAVPRFAAARQTSAQLFGFVEERIGGAEDLRANGAMGHTLLRLDHLLQDHLARNRVAWVLNTMTQAVTNLVLIVGYALGLAVGAYLYSTGQATLGTAFLIVTYIGMLSTPLQVLREQSQQFQQSAASFGRIQELLRLEPSTYEKEPAARESNVFSKGPLAVSFQGVRFEYDDGMPGGAKRLVLDEVSFRLPAGRILGVLGRTGSGKTTLTRLLFRLYDPTRGTIRVGGLDLRTLPVTAIRQGIGMVTQDVQLFQGTLRDNLAFFDPALSDAQLVGALETLGLLDWMRLLPQGLDTPIATGGTGLSAGEAQLLAFVRVLIRDPGLVILDEASSRLDPVTEARFERAIDRLLQNRTGILIAHRLKTVERADEVLVLEGGRVVESGARLELARDPRSRFHSLLRAGLGEALA